MQHRRTERRGLPPPVVLENLRLENLRTDKLAIAYQAALHVAYILIWVRC
ncbi:hypothetical protein ACFVYE_33895 [Streptomyces sp. NPDC058239]